MQKIDERNNTEWDALDFRWGTQLFKPGCGSLCDNGWKRPRRWTSLSKAVGWQTPGSGVEGPDYVNAQMEQYNNRSRSGG